MVVYATERVYVRGLAKDRYSLADERRRLLRETPRVVRAGEGEIENYNEHSGDHWILGPGDETFRTQSLQCHFVTLDPGGRNKGHGHQNEALFYILEGFGYEMHDGKRYDWSAGDVVSVHNDAVHWHNNGDPNNRARAIVIKAKSLWLFLGLIQQGSLGTVPEDEERWGPRQDFKVARMPGDETLRKVIKPDETPWISTPHGRLRLLSDESLPFRIRAVDAQLLEIPAERRSGKLWQIADEIFYVVKGRGYDLHWDVDVEITEKYYARIAKEPSRWEWGEGDLVWIPHNSVHQHFNADPSNPAVLLTAQNRLYKQLGYGHVEHLEAAPGFPYD